MDFFEKVFQKGKPFFNDALKIAQRRIQADVRSVFAGIECAVADELIRKFQRMPGLSVRKI